MTEKIEKRHKALREKLVEIAEQRIAADGMEAVKARDLAKTAECALGAIYNVFDDIREIILIVNGRTFQRLGDAVQHDLAGRENTSPTERLITIANAYLDFAVENTNLWRSLFDVPFSSDLNAPQWYWNELDRLFQYIAGPVNECCAQMSDTDRTLMTRALFSSVHGIVTFGIENRTTPVAQDELERMIELIIIGVSGNK